MKFIPTKEMKNMMFEVYSCDQISKNSRRYLFIEFRRNQHYKFIKITFYNFIIQDLVLLVRIEFFILEEKNENI